MVIAVLKVSIRLLSIWVTSYLEHKSKITNVKENNTNNNNDKYCVYLKLQKYYIFIVQIKKSNTKQGM